MQTQTGKKRLANVGVGFRTKYTGQAVNNKPIMKLWIRPEDFKALPLNAKGAVEISVFIAGPGKDGKEKNYHFDLAPALSTPPQTEQARPATKGNSALPF